MDVRLVGRARWMNCSGIVLFFLIGSVRTQKRVSSLDGLFGSDVVASNVIIWSNSKTSCSVSNNAKSEIVVNLLCGMLAMGRILGDCCAVSRD